MEYSTTLLLVKTAITVLMSIKYYKAIAETPEYNDRSPNTIWIRKVKGMKVFLDDARETPPGWTRVYWPDEAIELLKTGEVEEISLDHDLGDDERGTGYDVVLWIEEAVITQGFKPPKMKVHTANVSARSKMEQGIQTIHKRAQI